MTTAATPSELDRDVTANGEQTAAGGAQTEPSREQTAAHAEHDAGNGETVVAKRGAWKFTAFALIGCFTTGLLLCWRTNFSHAALDVAPMFDSGKYISSTEMVMNATTFIHHFTLQEWTTICGALKEPLMMDGPVLPLLGAAWFTLIQKRPDLFDMRAALALQALLHAVSACCMFFAARRVLKNEKWAMFTGLLWAAFPSAVLGAGRFMTENITSTLLLLTACVVPLRATDRYIRSFALGVIAATVGLLKAALLPGITAGFLAVAFTLWSNREANAKSTLKRLTLHAVSIVFGAMLILTPWLLFTKEATGSFSLTAQREPVLNIVIGGNSETDGWSGNPETDFVKLFDTVNGDKAGIFLGIWRANFAELSNIAIRRIVRLWSSPWNDCLSKFLGLTLPLQWLWHQVILNLAILGTLFIVFRKTESTDRSIDPILCLGGTLLASHLVYMVFNASPRQAFTSMPYVVLFAAFALYQISCSTKQLKVAVCAAASILVWFLAVTFDSHSILQTVHLGDFAFAASWFIYALAAVLCSYALTLVNNNKKNFLPSLGLQLIPAAIICAAFAASPKIVPEWQCNLNQNTAANRTVVLNSALNPDWAVLVVDGDFGITRASININGTKLTEPLSSFSTFTSNKNLMVNYSVFGGVSNKNPEQLRQWRAAVVPTSLLRAGENTISLSAPAGNATIYGSVNHTQDGRLITPTLQGFSACKLLSETQPKLEPRYSEALTAAAANGKCWLIHNNKKSSDDLSPEFGDQVGQYRAFLCLGFNQAKHKSGTEANLQQLTLESSPIVISKEAPFIKRYAVPKELGQSNFVNVTLDGQFAEPNVNVSSEVDVRNLTNLGSDLCLPNSVKLIKEKSFQLTGTLAKESLNQPNQFFEVKFQSKNTIHLSRLSLKVIPCERPDFAKSKVAVY